MLFGKETKENAIPLPEIECMNFGFRHPTQYPLITGINNITGETVSCVKVHVFGVVVVVDKGDDATITPVGQCETGFFLNLTQEAIVRRFSCLKFAADANPLALVDVLFFLAAVEQEHRIFGFDIAQCG